MMRMKKQWQFSLLIGLLVGLNLTGIGMKIANAQESTETINYEAGFYYTVKSGDTLWDLSQRFNDTPWQWPDLWQENKQLSNPHWIYPGERIRLFRKTDQYRDQPRPTKIPVDNAQFSASTPIEKPKPEVYFWYANIDRLGFIRTPPVNPLGTIFKARDDKTLISKGDLVYIRHLDAAKRTDLNPGMRLSIYRTLSPTKDRNAERNIGTQHILLGIAEVTKNESGYALAKILNSFSVIRIDDLVMAYRPGNPQIMVVDSTPGMEGRIITGEDHTQYLGELFIAYIDKGRQDDILPGQIYNIYYQESDKNIPLEKVDIGSFIVLHTEETTSTVVITDSARQILPGQPFRTP